MFARSVWNTGDTFAMQGHNLIGFENGIELKNLHNRYMPPLQFYLAAPFVGLASEQGSAFAARLPFAICGLLTIAMIFFWLWRSEASVSMWLLMAAGILGNVSLMLYARQCRYYALVIFTTTVLAYLYIHRDGRKRTIFAMALVLLLLLASNYMSYVAALICLAVDYFLWGRKEHRLRYFELAIIFVPQFIFGGWLLSVYNLFEKKVGYYAMGLWLKDRADMLYWNLRDLNKCEFGVGALILSAPLLYFYKKDKRLIRGPAAIFTYILVVVLLSPKQPEWYTIGNVRYIVAVIPLCITMTALSIQTLTCRVKWLAIPLALLAFGTNVLHGGPLVGGDTKTFQTRIIAEGRFRSTVAEFVGELISPPRSAYRSAADWLNQNLKEEDTVWVMPNFATYPLMYHSPKVTYAWQLKEKSGQFSNLPDIHFEGKILPQYLIVFGHCMGEAFQTLRKYETKEFSYQRIKTLEVYWYDLIRPELFWHSFREVKNYSRVFEAVYIYKRAE